jgi:hypothetical protein
MKRLTIFLISAFILMTGSECEKSPEPVESTIGHLKITVTYPEVVIENGKNIGFIHVPGEGAEVSLFYNKNAKCLGYKDALLTRALEGDTLVQPKYVTRADETGEILFQNIQAGEYYLLVVARKLYSYSEKYISVNVGDTLELKKDFSYSAHFFKKLEPWIYEMPFLN